MNRKLRLKQSLELIVIDSDVEGYQALYDDVMQNYGSDRIQIHVIDSKVDGIKEISRLLAEASSRGESFAALHIVSHGDAGEVYLGNVSLDYESMPEYASEIAGWSDGLTSDANIMIYGCNLAADVSGEMLIDAINVFTGVGVAASDDVTGHIDQDGDWELEYTAGLFSGDVVFSSSIVESWNHSLHQTIGDESGTSHKSIAADNDGNQTIVVSDDDSGSSDVFVSRYSNVDISVPLSFHDGSDFENIQVNNNGSPSGGDHRHAVVGSAANGDFVVAWVWSNDSETVSEVYAKVFDADGNVVKDQFSVASGSFDSHNVTVAMNESGEFVVGWEQFNGADNDIYFATYNRDGDVSNGPTQIDASVIQTSGLVVSINNQGDVVTAYNGSDPDSIHSRVFAEGSLSQEYTFSASSTINLRDIAVDLNDQRMIGIAFVADAGSFGAENQDVFSILLQYESVGDTFTNVLPVTTFNNGFNSYSAQMTNHSGEDAGLEYAPSITVINNVEVGGDSYTAYHVTWHGHGSWDRNISEGTVVDSGVPVTSATSFPLGIAVADNGVFISTAVYGSNELYEVSEEASLQNDLDDFNSDAKFTSINSFRDRSAIAVVFEDEDGDIIRQADSVNQAPVAVDSTRRGLENLEVQFQVADFEYSDFESDALHSIRIESLPVDGSAAPFGELTLFGTPITQANIDANGGVVVASSSIGSLRWNPPSEVHGANLASFEFSVRDGESWSTPATMQLGLRAEDRLWVSTLGDSSATTSIPGDGTGTLQFGGTDLTFGEDTFGYWSDQFTPDGVSVDGVHYVNQGISIGSSSPIFLNRGDILFSVKSTTPIANGPAGAAVVTTLPSDMATPIEVRAGDIIRFRPTSSDYSTGDYEIVASLEQMYPIAPADYELNSFALVEQDTIVGDRLLKAGDILFSDSEDGFDSSDDIDGNDIKILELDVSGSASTGVISLLIEGSQVGVESQISGLDIIEARTSVGAGSEVILHAGSILASVESAEDVGNNGNSVEAQDIFVLDVSSTTTATSSAEATASLFFDGSDVGGDENLVETSIDALSLLGSPDPALTLISEPGDVDLGENDVYRFSASDFVSDATQSNLVSVVITSLPDSAFGTLLLRNEPVVVGQIVDADDIEFLVYQPGFNLHFDSDFFSYRAASDSEVLAEASINLAVTAKADDVLIGSGTGIDATLPTDIGVPSDDAGDQNEHEIAHLDDGGAVVVWRSSNGGVDEIRLQVFDQEFAAIGIEIVFLDNTISGMKTTPSVTGLDDGGFLVTATVDNGTDTDIWAARYNDSGQQVDVATGTTMTSVPEVLLGGGSSQYNADVARLQDGFVIVYQDDSLGSVVRARVYHGDSFENDIRISPSTAGVTYATPTVEPLKQGGFVAAWNKHTFIGDTIEVQLFDVNGVAASSKVGLGSSSNVNSAASVAVLENNQTVVVWSESATGNPLGENRIVGAILDAEGNELPTGEVPIIQNDSMGVSPNVVAIGDGGFVVAVGNQESDSSPQSIVAYRFDSQFDATGPPLLTDNNLKLGAPQLEYLPGSGQIAAVWNRESVSADDDLVANVFNLDANADFGERIPLGLTVIPSVDSNEAIDNVEIRGLPSGARLFGNGVEIFGPVFNLLGADLGAIELELPPGVSEADYQLIVQTNDDGASATHTHEMSAQLNITTKTLSGTIYNDENADGLVGDEGGFDAVEVVLYEDINGVRTELDRTSTIDSTGYYEFVGLTEGVYFVAVDSKTIGSEFVTESGDADKVWAEQTYGGDGSIRGSIESAGRAAGFMRGGRFGTRSDDASTLELSEHVIRRTIVATDLASDDVDFGFSFNVVTNVEDAPGANADDRTVQGSLRQFINNANLIDGPNVMKFVPAVAPNESSDEDNDLSTGHSWWSINVVSELQAITSSGTILDGQAWQNGATGLVERDFNAFSVQDGFAGPVGSNGIAFLQTEAPELELVGNASIAHGFKVRADITNPNVSNVEINNFAIHGFGDSFDEAAIYVLGDSSEAAVTLANVKIQNNVIGTGPNSTSYIERTELFRGVLIENASDGLISNNVIVGNTSSGIRFLGSPQSSGWTIVDNEIANNSMLNSRADGIDATGASDFVIRRNAVHGNHGMGVDNHSTEAAISNWIIEDNSIFDNGRGTDAQGSGIRLSGDGSVVRFNSISNNQFAGVAVTGYFDFDAQVFVPAKHNLISQNSFEANGTIEIDLVVDGFGGIPAATYDANSNGRIDAAEATGTLAAHFAAIASSITDDGFITLDELNAYFTTIVSRGGGDNFNDGAVNSNTANEGLDLVNVTSAEFVLGNLELEFEILNPNTDRVELYTTLPGDTDPDSEASKFFKSIDVSSMTDLGSGMFSISLAESDFPSDVSRDTSIVALAFDANDNTAEFGASAIPVGLNLAPTASASTIETDEEVTVSFSLSDFENSDPESDGIKEIVIASLPDVEDGALLFNGTVLVGPERININSLGDLQFVPAENFEGVATFDFAVSDGTSDSNEAVMSVTVNNISDAPTGTSQTISINEDQLVPILESYFGFSDAVDNNADAFNGVRIMSYSGGSLTTNAGEVPSGVAGGHLITITELGELRFQPDANLNGAGAASINFRVVDTGAVGRNVDTEDRTLTFDIISVNDRPAGVDFSIVINEQSSRPFVASEFLLSDADDAPSENSLKAIQIIDWSGPGRITLDGMTLDRNAIVNAADIGRLALETDSVTTDSFGQVEFVVIDDGGTDNGGIAESLVPSVIDFEVRQINRAPVINPVRFLNLENVAPSHAISVTDEIPSGVVFSFAGSANDNALFEFTPDGKSVRFINAPDFESSQSVDGTNRYIIEIVATDDQGLNSVVQPLVINVRNVVESVALVDDVVVNDGSGVSDVSLFANDNGGAPLPRNKTVSVVSQPGTGIVTINPDGTFVFNQTVQADASAPVEFTYQIESGGESTTADVTFRQATLQGPLTNNDPSGDDSDPASNGATENESGDPAGSTDPALPPDGAGSIPNQGSSDDESTGVVTRIPAPLNNSGANTINNDISPGDFDFTSNLVGSNYTNYAYQNFVDTGLLTSDLVSRAVETGRAGLQELAEDFALAALFWDEMDSASHNYIEADLGELQTVIAVGTFGVSVAVGIAARWALLGISLGATYSQPLWVTTFDFLPVVHSGDDESIEQIVDNQS